MKKINRRKHHPAVLQPARWGAYAAAGAATAFTGTGSAEAEIHYSGVLNERISAHGGILHGGLTVKGFQLDPGDSFALRILVRSIEATGEAGVEVRGIGDMSFAGFVTTSYFGNRLKSYASKLGSGQQVSTAPRGFIRGGIDIGGGNMAYGSEAPSFNFQWDTKGTGFLGFKFDSGNGTQYGWARVFMRSDRRQSMILIDYAWGDPGDQVKTGDTGRSEAKTSAPASGSLGWLALGGAGLLAWRRARQGFIR
jgi:hypothetical protein